MPVIVFANMNDGWQSYVAETLYQDYILMTCRDLGADEVAFIDYRSHPGPRGTLSEINVKWFDNFESALNEYSTLKRVFLISPSDKYPHTFLDNYTHPSDAVYIVSRDFGINNIVPYVRETDDVVSIKTTTDYTIWTPVLIGIALYDRLLKVK